MSALATVCSMASPRMTLGEPLKATADPCIYKGKLHFHSCKHVIEASYIHRRTYPMTIPITL
jgi:hypothetical protein